MPIQDRFVEVLADHGPSARPRWTVGSGFLVGGRYLLTSGHVVATGTVYARRIGAEPGSPKEMWPAEVRLLGDLDTVDLALVELDASADELPYVGFARIDRRTLRTEVVRGCTVVGFPEFKKRGSGLDAVRDTVQLDGELPTSEELASGLLSLRLPQPQPRPLPPAHEALGASPWSGISGAAALVDGQVVGVVSEHHPREGASALTLVPISFIDRLPDAPQWWAALRARPSRMRLLPSPEPRQVGELPTQAEHFQRRGCDDHTESALASSQLILLTPLPLCLGGVGMTQLAAAAARRLWESQEIDLLVWSRADERDQVLKSYQEAATAVETEDFLGWLSRTNWRWLIVFDDLTDPANLADLWPPSCQHGRVLVITRDWQTLPAQLESHYEQVRRIEVGPFTPQEAASYVMASLGCGADDAAELARALSFQPLALAEAATYIRGHGLDCRQYRQRFADRKSVLPRVLAGGQALADAQRRAVTVAWSLGVEKPSGAHADRLAFRARYQISNGPQTMTLEAEGSNTAAITQQVLDAFFRQGGPADG